MKIQRSAVVLLLGMLLVTTLACGGESITWAIYSNSSLGISIQYPQDWTKSEGESGGVSFFTPKTDASDLGIVVVSVYEQEQPVTLSEWVDELIRVLSAGQTGFELSESSATTISDMLAQKVVYTYRSGQYSVKCIEVVSVKDNNIVYTIEFLADVTTYNRDVKTVQPMIDSFVIY